MGHQLYLRCSRHLCTWRYSRAVGISGSQFLAQSLECAPPFHAAVSSQQQLRQCCPEVDRNGTSPRCQNFPLREGQHHNDVHINTNIIFQCFKYWQYWQLLVWSRSMQFWMTKGKIKIAFPVFVPCPAAVRIWGVSPRTELAPDYQILPLTSPYRLSCLARCRCLQSIHSLEKTEYKCVHVTDQMENNRTFTQRKFTWKSLKVPKVSSAMQSICSLSWALPYCRTNLVWRGCGGHG